MVPYGVSSSTYFLNRILPPVGRLVSSTETLPVEIPLLETCCLALLEDDVDVCCCACLAGTGAGGDVAFTVRGADERPAPVDGGRLRAGATRRGGGFAAFTAGVAGTAGAGASGMVGRGGTTPAARAKVERRL